MFPLTRNTIALDKVEFVQGKINILKDILQTDMDVNKEIKNYYHHIKKAGKSNGGVHSHQHRGPWKGGNINFTTLICNQPI